MVALGLDEGDCGDMTAERVLPEDPRAFIQRCVQRHHMYWTYHSNMRFTGRFISRQHIVDAVNTYEVIESYPEDKYLPSYLVYAELDGEDVPHPVCSGGDDPAI